MKIIIYYGHDASAAKEFASALREEKHAAQIRHAPFFDQPEKADDVMVLDCVSEHDSARIKSAYAKALAADGTLRADGPTVAEYVAAGYQASNYPPAGYASRSTTEEINEAIAAQGAGGIGTDSGDQFSDEQLREAITAATGKAPHPQMGRKKLVAQFNALNAKPE